MSGLIKVSGFMNPIDSEGEFSCKIEIYFYLIIQPWVGFSWEGFVIEQILSCLDSLGHSRQPYFFKTSDGHELDLVLMFNGEIWAFEIKLSGSSGRKEMDKLKRTSEMIGADKMVLVSRTRKEIRGKHIVSTHLPGILRLMSEL